MVTKKAAVRLDSQVHLARSGNVENPGQTDAKDLQGVFFGHALRDTAVAGIDKRNVGLFGPTDRLRNPFDALGVQDDSSVGRPKGRRASECEVYRVRQTRTALA